LGMMTNDGDCLDCDYGDITDRIALTFRAAGHLFTPMFDWVSTGPVITPFGRSGGQPIDASDRDDAVQYSLRIARLDHPEDIQDQVKQGDMVLNYGIWTMFRTQGEELKPSYYVQDPYDPAAPIARDDREEQRDGLIFTANSYGKLFWGNVELGAEVALVYGTYKEQLPDDPDVEKTSVYKLGGALEASWRLRGEQDGIILNLMAGGASGDSAPGYGALDFSSTQRRQSAASADDRKLQNFQFSPDYHVDLLMFRRIVGTVTDAWYVRPGLTYMFDQNFAGKIAAIYSQAIFKRSVPGSSRWMGLELDGEISYGLEGPDPGPFATALAGGVAIPFGAFENPDRPEDQERGSFAWTFQARLYLTF
ncbi:MAG: TIGR04551 family protein, partial [Myxococcota bacterium]